MRTKIPAVNLARLTEARIINAAPGSPDRLSPEPGSRWSCPQRTGAFCAWWISPAPEPPARTIAPGCPPPSRFLPQPLRSILATLNACGRGRSSSNGVARDRRRTSSIASKLQATVDLPNRCFSTNLGAGVPACPGLGGTAFFAKPRPLVARHHGQRERRDHPRPSARPLHPGCGRPAAGGPAGQQTGSRAENSCFTRCATMSGLSLASCSRQSTVRAAQMERPSKGGTRCWYMPCPPGRRRTSLSPFVSALTRCPRVASARSSAPGRRAWMIRCGSRCRMASYSPVSKRAVASGRRASQSRPGTGISVCAVKRGENLSLFLDGQPAGSCAAPRFTTTTRSRLCPGRQPTFRWRRVPRRDLR